MPRSISSMIRPKDLLRVRVRARVRVRVEVRVRVS